MVVMNNVTIRDDRQFRALMGVSPSLFSQLLGKLTGTRQRKPGGGAKGRLATDRQKLKFILYYYKNYPTFDVLGAHFNLSRSKAHANVYKLSPLLHDTLAEMGMVPHRHFDSVDDFHTIVANRDYTLSKIWLSLLLISSFSFLAKLSPVIIMITKFSKLNSLLVLNGSLISKS